MRCYNFMCPDLMKDTDVLNCVRAPYRGRDWREDFVRDCASRKRYNRIMKGTVGYGSLILKLNKERDKFHGRSK